MAIGFIGSNVSATEKWPEGVFISTVNPSPSEQFIVDNTLPVLGTDPLFTSDQIVIPPGRLIGIYGDDRTYTDRARLTIADGVNVRPLGYAATNFYLKPPNRMQWDPVLSMGDLIEVPYVHSINGAYGTLTGGMPITAHFGSTVSTVQTPNDKGKVVKWIEKTVYHKNQSANTACTLTAAALPAFTPTVIMAWNAGTVIASGASVAPAWDTDSDTWIATFGNNVTDVLYSYGQGPEMIAGEVVRVEPITSTHELQGWLKWVTTQFADPGLASMLVRVPVTAVTLEVPSTISTNVYRLAYYPVAPWSAITVTVTGTLTNLDGSQTSLSGTEMSRASLPYTDYTRGVYYTIDAVTGYLRFASNVSVTAVTVSYSYETSYRGGIVWAPGTLGLTDGQYTGIPGTPSNLEISGCVGSLRCMIR